MDWDYGLVAAQEGQLWAINHHLQKNNYVLVSFLVERKNVFGFYLFVWFPVQRFEIQLEDSSPHLKVKKTTIQSLGSFWLGGCKNGRIENIYVFYHVCW